MKLFVMTDREKVYSEVSGIIEQLACGLDAVHVASADHAARAIDEDLPYLVMIDTKFGDFASVTRRIRDRYIRTCVIAIADDGSDAVEAFEAHATGYITRPVTAAKLDEELSYCMNLPENSESGSGEVQIMTDGCFEFFVNGVPANFKYKKTKDMLSFMLKRNGAMVSNEELIKLMWNEDVDSLDEMKLKSRQSYIRNIKANLEKVLAEAGCEGVVIKHRGAIAFSMDKIKLIS